MYDRLHTFPTKQSFFLFGPRATGKTTLLKKSFPNAIYLDLLDTNLYSNLLAYPARLQDYIPENFEDWIILDEVQKIPELLNEVHRLIEEKKYRFILTGSSSRKLRKYGTNLLGGRALTLRLYPLTAQELKGDFKLKNALKFGTLPMVFSVEDKEAYLKSYVWTYLKEEIQQEALTRNLSGFSKFIEAASFSQGAVMNMTQVAREIGLERKTVQNYFQILEDLMIAYCVPVFNKKAKRRLITHNKFYFFDAGLFQTIRPKGPLDFTVEIAGPALETLFLQELVALNDYLKLGYTIFYWRTSHQLEVDFVLYGPKGLVAIEVKTGKNLSPKDFHGMKAFSKDYPNAKQLIFYGGSHKLYKGSVNLIPVEEGIKNLKEYIT